jgi:GTP pyrophosphokinase/guanosine-3',5'-bis(diphosphate) 3'-pyrophosphohydrolase
MGKRATDKVLATAARALRLGGVDDVLERLGSAEMTGREVVTAVYPELGAVEGEEVDRKRAVIGLEAGQSFDRASCCEPLPGERIVGITFRGKGVTVHAIDCDRLSDYEDQPERWIDLRWHEGNHPAVYDATIDITVANDRGVLGRICTLIGEAGANISDLNFVERKQDFFRVLVRAEFRDVAQLHSLMLTLEAENNVAALSRYRDTSVPMDGHVPGGQNA